jgi:hypothetical protein
MPGGQWVPFEGYDTQHKCNPTTVKANPNSTAPRMPMPPKETSGFGDIEFADIEVDNIRSSQPSSPSTSTVKSRTQRQLQEPSSTSKVKQTSVQQTNDGSFPGWIWWLGLAILVLWVLR